MLVALAEEALPVLVLSVKGAGEKVLATEAEAEPGLGLPRCSSFSRTSILRAAPASSASA